MTIKNKGFTIKVLGLKRGKQLTAETISALQLHTFTIHFNDTAGEYWDYSFRADMTWFDVESVDPAKQLIKIRYVSEY